MILFFVGASYFNFDVMVSPLAGLPSVRGFGIFEALMKRNGDFVGNSELKLLPSSISYILLGSCLSGFDHRTLPATFKEA